MIDFEKRAKEKLGIDIVKDEPNLLSASSVNGDQVKSSNLEAALNLLIPQSFEIVRKMSGLVSEFLGSQSLLRIVSEGEANSRQALAIMQQIKQFDYNAKLSDRLGANVSHIGKIGEFIYKQNYVASLTRLAEGVSMQLKDDEDLENIQVKVEISESELRVYTTDRKQKNGLVINGMAAHDYIVLMLTGVFSFQWFAANVSQAFSSEPDLESIARWLQLRVLSRRIILVRDLKKMAFFVLQHANVDATKQLSNIGIE